MFGGFDEPTGYLSDTWTWDGSWAQHPGKGPTGRRFAAMAFDRERGVAVLYGGSGACQGNQCPQFHDTWLWNGSTWLEAKPSHSPQLMTDVVAYDPSSRSILMFGFVIPNCPGAGATCPPSHAETWKWTGSDWAQLQVFDSTSRMKRLLGYQFVLSHDPATGRMMLVGHISGTTPNTWDWDGATWSLIGEVGPQGIQFNMAEDAARRSVVVEDQFATWNWDGQHWNQLTVPSGPGNRQEAGMTYDDRVGRVLLFGGLINEVGVRSDLWAWDGQTWTQLDAGAP